MAVVLGNLLFLCSLQQKSCTTTIKIILAQELVKYFLNISVFNHFNKKLLTLLRQNFLFRITYLIFLSWLKKGMLGKRSVTKI